MIVCVGILGQLPLSFAPWDSCPMKCEVKPTFDGRSPIVLHHNASLEILTNTTRLSLLWIFSCDKTKILIIVIGRIESASATWTNTPIQPQCKPRVQPTCCTCVYTRKCSTALQLCCKWKTAGRDCIDCIAVDCCNGKPKKLLLLPPPPPSKDRELMAKCWQNVQMLKILKKLCHFATFCW